MCMHMGVGVGDVCVLERGLSVRVVVLVQYSVQSENKIWMGGTENFLLTNQHKLNKELFLWVYVLCYVVPGEQCFIFVFTYLYCASNMFYTQVCVLCFICQ